MSIDPRKVVSPKSRLNSLFKIIKWTQDWSLALGMWDNNRALLIRWNGDADHALGSPASHGYPTWFVLPKDMEFSTLSLVEEPNRSSAAAWLNADRDVEWKDPVPAG
ncbi:MULTISPECIES: hypothetical protein [unclassified Novosphingobium]|uniref:hypothetical protein n=1 Tax=unclassified Novosphingobium TaxID=2644732 RepID=UPI00149404F4|nr:MULTISPECIES: hypothetical protein [unclassified Novosphingobium]MBB3358622.1 hypothetical protein [Novosphingobium sp. BK256]MBB3374983.1 hypothetical protein [Novosphingobium sp. BK280]MBB3379329.1 hypothetical protein [Novosphingobium sp. BK258]MBB3421023.1 hypothetical protein [Novosphingobium sp. BK267]MBB3449404.1 hypothetical protein [Novosphingobium sp. BK352]